MTSPSPPGLDSLHHLQALKRDSDFLLPLDMIHMRVTIHRSGASVGFPPGPEEFHFEHCQLGLRTCTLHLFFTMLPSRDQVVDEIREIVFCFVLFLQDFIYLFERAREKKQKQAQAGGGRGRERILGRLPTEPEPDVRLNLIWLRS